ncbi:hypothetical protein [Cohaesibacter sp. ES.047]|uniref:hypothetical protein n=1 Tax=Cohaesibacter sp. ES.047 TaxID=1798205 RepID=UPI001FCEF613|nr:hypothetical protein [Cohaesibacter sp. ES.047]
MAPAAAAISQVLSVEPESTTITSSTQSTTLRMAVAIRSSSLNVMMKADTGSLRRDEVMVRPLVRVLGDAWRPSGQSVRVF